VSSGKRRDPSQLLTNRPLQTADQSQGRPHGSGFTKQRPGPRTFAPDQQRWPTVARLANRLGRVQEQEDRHRLICREKSRSQDMRDNIRWRHGRGTVEGYGDTQRTD
jgi:hypothetical protein